MNGRQDRATDLGSAVRVAQLKGGQRLAVTASHANRVFDWSPRPAGAAAAGKG